MSACGKDLTGLPEWVRADYYQAHKEHDCLWGDPIEAAPVPPRQLDTMVSLRLTAVEAKWLRERAALEGISLSALIRREALAVPPYFVRLTSRAVWA